MTTSKTGTQTMTSIKTAAEYHAAYRHAFEHDGLTQGAWHTERDGRQLACALGVIGPEVDGPSKCPAQIMPRWLAQMVPTFFDRQKSDDAFTWGLAFTAELARLDGKIPFSVIHDWQANSVCQLRIDAAKKRGRDPSAHKALQKLHLSALGGEKISAEEWHPILKAAYSNAYADAYSNAYADAYSNAYADAYSNAYADADAYAYSNAYAAYAAAAYSNADVYAYAYAYAWKRLADGMVKAVKRVEVLK